jgi:hypothetical protein
MNNFERNFSEQELIRREKLKELQTAGQDPSKIRNENELIKSMSWLQNFKNSPNQN